MRAPIGIRIRRKRQEVGLSQAALARNVGISAAYLNLIENNKRQIGGKLLMRIGECLDLDLGELSGINEARSIQTIEELFTDPLMNGIKMEPVAIRDLVARSPEAGAAFMRLYRAYVDATANIETYHHRLRSDPLLSQLLHQVLNRIAAMKSGGEILASVPDLTETEQKRFIGTINNEANDLSRIVRSLVDYFERTVSRQKPVSPMADLDEAIISHDNHFPELEDAAVALRAEIAGDGWNEAALADALASRFGIRCRKWTGPMPGQYRYDPSDRVLWFRSSATASTCMFQMARLYAMKAAADALDNKIAELALTTDEARLLARRALSSYAAGAMMMPYDAFLGDAEAKRYDIDLLTHLYDASFEQVAHRLVTLRRKGAEGLPFGFLRADRSGRLTKRFPLPGLVLPVYGHGCLLWPVYSAFGAGGFIRQVSEFPGGGRFLLIAKAVSKQVSAYDEQPLMFSIMLACDVLHADRTVYGQGLDLFHTPVPVGPSCMLCPRRECSHRQGAPSGSAPVESDPIGYGSLQRQDYPKASTG